MQRSRLQFAATIVVAALSTLSALLLPGAGPAGAAALARASGTAPGAAADPGHPAGEATEPPHGQRTAEVASWLHESVASPHGPVAAPDDTGASGPLAATTEASSVPGAHRVAHRFVPQHAVTAEGPGTRTSGRAPPA